jgi:uroporphyrinogen-III synthase
MASTVVLTQPAARGGALAARLRASGIDVIELPLTETVPAGPHGPRALFAAFAGCRWVLWPSPGAIDAVLGGFAADGLGWPAGVGIGLIGPGSREALRAWQGAVPGLASAETIEPDGPTHDARALLERPELGAIAGLAVAVPRRADGREDWLDALRARGATVLALDAYEARRLAPTPAAMRALAAALDASAQGDAGSVGGAGDAGGVGGAGDAGGIGGGGGTDRRGGRTRLVFAVASADAGARLGDVVAHLGRADVAHGCPVLTQHPRIAHAMACAGWRSVRTHAPGTDALVAAIESARDTPR